MSLQAARRPTRARWISISRYAAIYGVSRPTVYKWLEAGLLEYLRVDRCIRVRDQKPRCAVG